MKPQHPRVWIRTGASATPATATIDCSFCGKSREQVRGIVAGPTPEIGICNECVDLCVEIFSEMSADADAGRGRP